MAVQSWAWIFFVTYLLVSTFAVLNLFIAVVVRAMEEQIATEVKADVAEHQREDALAAAKILDEDRKSTRLNSSHANISYAVFCLKKNAHRAFRSEAHPYALHSR